MKVHLDLHVHSSYSKSTSPYITLLGLAKGAQEKGINILGTGDCLCDEWLEVCRKELKKNEKTQLLVLSNDGVIRNSGIAGGPVYYIPTVEVNCIWGKKQAHILLIFPAFIGVMEKVKTQLVNYGNLNQGRPSIALSPKELQTTVKEINENILFIPAHILTPHYGLLGSKNNISSIWKEFSSDSPPDALETGLSASCEMVWSIKELRDIPFVSFSDAHSVRNIAREYTVIDNNNELTYPNIIKAIKHNEISTREYIPQLGKYYLDGHRKCKHSYNPKKRLCKYDGIERYTHFEVCRHHKKLHDSKCGECESAVETICPVCSKNMTKGVLHRIMELSGGNSDEGVGDVFIDLVGNVIENVGKLRIEAGFDGQFGAMLGEKK